MYISLGSLEDADTLTARMKELIISLARYHPRVSPVFIQITEPFHLINAACYSAAE